MTPFPPMQLGIIEIMSDSQYISNFMTSTMADEAYQALKTEMVYIPREQLTFSIFGKTFSLPRDKAFHGDIDEDGSYPLYRYGAKDYPPAL